MYGWTFEQIAKMSIYQQNIALEVEEDSEGVPDNTITFNDERAAEAWLKSKGFK